MEKLFLDAWDERANDVREWIAQQDMADIEYKMLLEGTLLCLFGDHTYGAPSHERVTDVDYGAYQGTRVFVFAADGYQPDEYWATFVDYGSCTGCDTLLAILGYGSGKPSREQTELLWTLCLHMIQKAKKIAGYDLDN